MRQSKIMSLLESKANAVLGLLISYLFTFFALPLIWGITPSASEALGITFSYFFLSFARSYVVRRYFNNLQGS